jgi:hypothetical protein
MGGAPYWSTPHTFTTPQYGFLVQLAWLSSFDPSMGGALYWSTLHAFFAMPQCGFPVQQVGPSFLPPLTQQSPPSTSWFGEWDPSPSPAASVRNRTLTLIEREDDNRS